MEQQYKEVRRFLQEELDSCISFWLQHGMDDVNGGIYTCLDRKGEIYSTDKSVWMQGRAAWTFSRLCNQYGEKKELQSAAASCLNFLEQYCINQNAGSRMYFQVTADGRPLRQRRYWFSECFYAMANAEYFALCGEPQYIRRARNAYELVSQLNAGDIKDPTGLNPKIITETRSGRALATPMIDLNLCDVMLRCDADNSLLYKRRMDQSAQDILRYHFKPELGCTLETVGMDGTFWSDVSAGRVVNPGHSIECAWFLLRAGQVLNNENYKKCAAKIFDMAYDMGWDTSYGGLLYYVDCLGYPSEAYEHDMKLWWPHNELMIASLMFYLETAEERYLHIFDNTLAYSRQYFCDPDYPEWYGYLRRDGKPTQPSCKGSTFKGPFHLPRMLMMTESLLHQVCTDL